MLFRSHQAEQSLLEGVFARGDRRLSRALLVAFRSGCRFDGWSEWFDFGKWQEAFATTGTDPAFYANRTRRYDEVLPWEHLATGVTKAFLLKEDRGAEQGLVTPDCRAGTCAGCGVCPACGLPLPGEVQS